VLGRVQGDTTAYEFEDDEDDEGTLEQDSMATMEELKARHRELKLKEVRLLDERVRRMEAEEREAGAFRPQPRPLLGGGGSGGDGGGGGGGGRDRLLDNDGENLQLKTTKVHYLFGPTNRARVLTAFLQELILPELGENDMNFHYSRKMTVAMEALGLVEDNATIKKFENCYHKATVTTFTDAKKSFGSKFIDMVLDHSHLPLIKFGKKGDEPPNMPIHKVELPKLTERVGHGMSHFMTGWCCGFVVESNRVEFAAELWLRDIFDSGIFLAFGINPAEHPPRLSHIAYLYLVVQTRLKIYPASSRGGCPSYGTMSDVKVHQLELVKEWLLDANRCPTSWPNLPHLRTAS